MGLDCDLFLKTVDEHFICSMCLDCMEDPVRISMCDHMFCCFCICQWMERHNQCPLCRTYFYFHHLVPLSKDEIKKYSRLVLKCPFFNDGCKQVVAIKHLKNHMLRCAYNKQAPSACAYCGKFLHRRSHRCWRQTVSELSNSFDATPADHIYEIPENQDVSVEAMEQIEHHYRLENDLSSRNLFQKMFIYSAAFAKFCYRRLLQYLHF
ncbi:E3 ubiquitin-protein ligase NRDP1-like [Teleopsis dalmanni]|uniref:E3 ubiquitin-protein ligase NRDP1-like n=1 Tax=Teleopsis dalmanni TaxID=139649 RepID=UPI000D32B8A8|nr:E3 ubiquitin-protein ligase NRDP1-like [Teleopsis dalmanni]